MRCALREARGALSRTPVRDGHAACLLRRSGLTHEVGLDKAAAIVVRLAAWLVRRRGALELRLALLLRIERGLHLLLRMVAWHGLAHAVLLLVEHVR